MNVEVSPAIKKFKITQESYATIIKIKIVEKAIKDVYIHSYDNHIELMRRSSDERIMKYWTNCEARMSWARYEKGCLYITIPIKRSSTNIHIMNVSK